MGVESVSATTSTHASATGRSRRQALKVIAAVAALPLGALALRHFGGQPAYETWQGESLGGPASITLWHPDGSVARGTIDRMRTEVERLEQVFSLFRPDSEITRLNSAGHLESPSADLVAVLDDSIRIGEISDGAFDPSVQPLWRVYDDHFRANPDDDVGPPRAAIDAARALVSYRGLDVGRRRIAFARPGMAVTLNGIAQGYITDRISDLLRQEGFHNAVVDLGEIRAIGADPDGAPWSIGLRDPRRPLAVDRTIAIADQAVAVSGGYGTRFGRSASHHIFDPATGLSATGLLDVSVIAPRAVVADALSTAIYVAGEAAAPRLLAAYPGARALMTRA